MGLLSGGMGRKGSSSPTNASSHNLNATAEEHNDGNMVSNFPPNFAPSSDPATASYIPSEEELRNQTLPGEENAYLLRLCCSGGLGGGDTGAVRLDLESSEDSSGDADKSTNETAIDSLLSRVTSLISKVEKEDKRARKNLFSVDGSNDVDENANANNAILPPGLTNHIIHYCFSLPYVLYSSDQREPWMWNVQGLPSALTDSAITVTQSSKRWPLIFDPQNQALAWLRRNASDLKYCALKDSDLARKLKWHVLLERTIWMDGFGGAWDTCGRNGNSGPRGVVVRSQDRMGEHEDSHATSHGEGTGSNQTVHSHNFHTHHRGKQHGKYLHGAHGATHHAGSTKHAQHGTDATASSVSAVDDVSEAATNNLKSPAGAVPSVRKVVSAVASGSAGSEAHVPHKAKLSSPKEHHKSSPKNQLGDPKTDKNSRTFFETNFGGAAWESEYHENQHAEHQQPASHHSAHGHHKKHAQHQVSGAHGHHHPHHHTSHSHHHPHPHPHEHEPRHAAHPHHEHHSHHHEHHHRHPHSHMHNVDHHSHTSISPNSKSTHPRLLPHADSPAQDNQSPFHTLRDIARKDFRFLENSVLNVVHAAGYTRCGMSSGRRFSYPCSGSSFPGDYGDSGIWSASAESGVVDGVHTQDWLRRPTLAESIYGNLDGGGAGSRAVADTNAVATSGDFGADANLPGFANPFLRTRHSYQTTPSAAQLKQVPTFESFSIPDNYLNLSRAGYGDVSMQDDHARRELMQKLSVDGDGDFIAHTPHTDRSGHQGEHDYGIQAVEKLSSSPVKDTFKKSTGETSPAHSMSLTQTQSSPSMVSRSQSPVAIDANNTGASGRPRPEPLTMLDSPEKPRKKVASSTSNSKVQQPLIPKHDGAQSALLNQDLYVPTFCSGNNNDHASVIGTAHFHPGFAGGEHDTSGVQPDSSHLPAHHKQLGQEPHSQSLPSHHPHPIMQSRAHPTNGFMSAFTKSDGDQHSSSSLIDDFFPGFELFFIINNPDVLKESLALTSISMELNIVNFELPTTDSIAEHVFLPYILAKEDPELWRYGLNVRRNMLGAVESGWRLGNALGSGSVANDLAINTRDPLLYSRRLILRRGDDLRSDLIEPAEDAGSQSLENAKLVGVVGEAAGGEDSKLFETVKDHEAQPAVPNDDQGGKKKDSEAAETEKDSKEDAEKVDNQVDIIKIGNVVYSSAGVEKEINDKIQTSSNRKSYEANAEFSTTNNTDNTNNRKAHAESSIQILDLEMSMLYILCRKEHTITEILDSDTRVFGTERLGAGCCFWGSSNFMQATVQKEVAGKTNVNEAEKIDGGSASPQSPQRALSPRGDKSPRMTRSNSMSPASKSSNPPSSRSLASLLSSPNSPNSSLNTSPNNTSDKKSAKNLWGRVKSTRRMGSVMGNLGANFGSSKKGKSETQKRKKQFVTPEVVDHLTNLFFYCSRWSALNGFLVVANDQEPSGKMERSGGEKGDKHHKHHHQQQTETSTQAAPDSNTNAGIESGDTNAGNTLAVKSVTTSSTFASAMPFASSVGLYELEDGSANQTSAVSAGLTNLTSVTTTSSSSPTTSSTHASPTSKSRKGKKNNGTSPTSKSLLGTERNDSSDRDATSEDLFTKALTRTTSGNGKSSILLGTSTCWGLDVNFFDINHPLRRTFFCALGDDTLLKEKRILDAFQSAKERWLTAKGENEEIELEYLASEKEKRDNYLALSKVGARFSILDFRMLNRAYQFPLHWHLRAFERFVKSVRQNPVLLGLRKTIGEGKKAKKNAVSPPRSPKHKKDKKHKKDHKNRNKQQEMERSSSTNRLKNFKRSSEAVHRSTSSSESAADFTFFQNLSSSELQQLHAAYLIDLHSKLTPSMFYQDQLPVLLALWFHLAGEGTLSSTQQGNTKSHTPIDLQQFQFLLEPPPNYFAGLGDENVKDDEVRELKVRRNGSVVGSKEDDSRLSKNEDGGSNSSASKSGLAALAKGGTSSLFGALSKSITGGAGKKPGGLSFLELLGQKAGGGDAGDSEDDEKNCETVNIPRGLMLTSSGPTDTDSASAECGSSGVSKITAVLSETFAVSGASEEGVIKRREAAAKEAAEAAAQEPSTESVEKGDGKTGGKVDGTDVNKTDGKTDETNAPASPTAGSPRRGLNLKRLASKAVVGARAEAEAEEAAKEAAQAASKNLKNAEKAKSLQKKRNPLLKLPAWISPRMWARMTHLEEFMVNRWRECYGISPKLTHLEEFMVNRWRECYGISQISESNNGDNHINQSPFFDFRNKVVENEPVKTDSINTQPNPWFTLFSMPSGVIKRPGDLPDDIEKDIWKKFSFLEQVLVLSIFHPTSVLAYLECGIRERLMENMRAESGMEDPDGEKGKEGEGKGVGKELPSNSSTSDPISSFFGVKVPSELNSPPSAPAQPGQPNLRDNNFASAGRTSANTPANSKLNSALSIYDPFLRMRTQTVTDAFLEVFRSSTCRSPILIMRGGKDDRTLDPLPFLLQFQTLVGPGLGITGKNSFAERNSNTSDPRSLKNTSRHAEKYDSRNHSLPEMSTSQIFTNAFDKTSNRKHYQSRKTSNRNHQLRQKTPRFVDNVVVVIEKGKVTVESISRYM